MSFLILSQLMNAQYSFSGKVTDKNNQQLAGVQIILSKNDSLFAVSLTNERGQFSIGNLPKAEYSLQILYPGFTPIEEQRDIFKNINAEFVLVEEMDIELDDVIITADPTNLVRRTGTGEIFYLSESAKNSGDPYRALREIPRLNVNESLQTVSMIDGGKLLVLIDGKIINTGITPIDPKDIESVEVIDVVSARYMRMGVKNILNIKLKPKREPYQFFQTATRHDVPLRYSMGVVYFEVGNPKYSLYGRGALDRTVKDDSEFSTWQKDIDYFKESAGDSQTNNKVSIGELLFKWSVTENDYIAAHVYGKWNDKNTKTWGEGIFDRDQKENFSLTSADNNVADIKTASLYYKHDFTPEKTLEATLAYNKNSDNNKGERSETYPHDLYNNLFEYRSDRSSANLNIDYSWQWNKVNSLNIGSATNYINDNINKISDNVPVFHHKAWNEYLYATFSSKAGNLLYMVSAGLESIMLKAGESSNQYVRPRASLSGTYRINSNNSTRFSYTLTNQTPNVGQLNPYNTSTDPLVIIKGNPKLLPEQTHKIEASYTLNTKGFYFTPSITYNLSNDIIEPFGYKENGTFVNTFNNMGKYKSLSTGGNITYRFKENRGNIYIGAYHHTDYFEEMSAKQSFSLSGGIWVYYKKWIFGGDVNYRNYVFSPTSRIKQLTPAYSQFQVNYNFTKDFYVAVAIPYFIGKLSTETITQVGTYNSYYKIRMTDASSHPWILLRYTFRKNSKQKIKLDNVVNSKEEGISL